MIKNNITSFAVQEYRCGNDVSAYLLFLLSLKYNATYKEYHNLGFFYSLQGKIDYNSTGEITYNLLNTNDAKDNLLVAEKMNMNCYETKCALGIIELKNENFNKALAYFTQAQSINVLDEYSKWCECAVRYQLKDYTEVINITQSLLENMKLGYPHRFMYLLFLANAFHHFSKNIPRTILNDIHEEIMNLIFLKDTTDVIDQCCDAIPLLYIENDYESILYCISAMLNLGIKLEYLPDLIQKLYFISKEFLSGYDSNLCQTFYKLNDEDLILNIQNRWYKDLFIV